MHFAAREISRPAPGLPGGDLCGVTPTWVWDFRDGLPSGASFTRASSAGWSDASGILHTAATNTPRLDFDPVSGQALGLLVEASATNLLLAGRQPGASPWVTGSITAAFSETGIDATANAATRLTATAAGATVMQAVTGTSAARTFSLFVKRVTGSGAVSLTMDGGATWTAIGIGSGWSRFSLVTTSSNPVVGLKLATSGDAVAVDFAQLEVGGFASSPIATTTSAVTRVADLCSMGGTAFTDLFDALRNGGTLVAEFMLQGLVSGVAQRAIQFSDGTAYSRHVLYRAATGGALNSVTVFNNVVVTQTTLLASPVKDTVYRMAYAVKPNWAASALNGGKETVQTGFGPVPTALNLLGIGSAFGTASEQLCGWIRRIEFYQSILPGETVSVRSMP